MQQYAGADAAQIDIGGALDDGGVGWTEGVCYVPVAKAMVGDSLVFDFTGHDVYKMPSKDHFTNCDFSDALLIAEVGESPFEYYITEQDERYV